MVFKNRVLSPMKNWQTIKYVLLLLLGLLVLGALSLNASALQHGIIHPAGPIAQAAEAAPALVQPVAAPAASASAANNLGAEANSWVTCTPTEVTTYPDFGRLHVRCVESYGGVTFFALGTADAAKAARTLSVLTAAQLSGRTLTILYNPADTSGEAIGCAASDCRLIIGVGILN